MNPLTRLPNGLLRDRPDTAFSRILSAFLGPYEQLRAAVFFDSEGECVDYASRVDPYEAMVFSATLLNPTKALSQLRSLGAPMQWILEAERLEALVRLVGDDLFLALWTDPGGLTSQVLVGIDPLVELLSRESGLLPAVPGQETLEVETRQAKGWGYAPRAIRRHGVALRDLEVLGRWTEPGPFSEQESVCFRVRTAEQEWTLVHDPVLQRWYRR
ncbi:MAG: hypothetical protein QM778_07615 [Myxococcales bacterium]